MWTFIDEPKDQVPPMSSWAQLSAQQLIDVRSKLFEKLDACVGSKEMQKAIGSQLDKLEQVIQMKLKTS